jgi:16S rRNA (cytosine1402-N4)-methyltransferase
MLDEVVRFLDPQPGAIFVDCTLGAGGHAAAIAERVGPSGLLLCFDKDAEALESARERLRPFGRRCRFFRSDFRDLASIVAAEGIEAVSGIHFDLGISSMHVDRAERGFSFSRTGPLDMRMDRAASLTAADIVNTWSEQELADLFWSYGEERQSRKFAAMVVRNRPFRTTTDLASALEQAAGRAGGRPTSHPATKVFLALRIRVNGELDSLHAVLPLACGLLSPGKFGQRGGRISVIAFHSLEDRIVKHFLKTESTDCICPPELPVCRCDHRARLRLLARGIKPTAAEVAANPRARSAILRVAERLEAA